MMMVKWAETTSISACSSELPSPNYESMLLCASVDPITANRALPNP
jgi:hypothetical protein